MRIHSLRNILKGFALVVGALALTNACSKKKSGSQGGGGPVVGGGQAYGVNSLLNCPIPSQVSATLRSTLGQGSTLFVYVVRVNTNVVRLYGELVIPDMNAFSGGYTGGSLSTCLTSNTDVQTYRQSTITENIMQNVTLVGNGANITLLSAAAVPVYFTQSAVMGQVLVEIPSARIYDQMNLVAQ